MKKEVITIDEKLKDHYLFYKYKIFVEVLPKMKSDYERLKYITLETVDSSPKKKRKEHDLDWYKRIDLKYALRHARCMYFMTRHTDATCQRALKIMEFEKPLKKTYGEFKELARKMNRIAYGNKQNYSDLLERKRIKKNIGKSSLEHFTCH